MTMKYFNRFSRRGSLREAARFDANNDGTISFKELQRYIQGNAKLWAMLAVNLNLPEADCREIATRVAFQLAKNLNKRERNGTLPSSSCEEEREPTVYEIADLLDFLQTPTGAQEFFHRTVFAAFDADNNGYLDYDELDQFLDVFYAADSIFAGDARLPPKFILKVQVLVEFDANQDGRLSFEEMRTLISGGAQCLQSSSALSTSSSLEN